MNQGNLLDLHGPKMDTATQILGDPVQVKAIQGPFKILNDNVFT